MDWDAQKKQTRTLTKSMQGRNPSLSLRQMGDRLMTDWLEELFAELTLSAYIFVSAL